MQNTGKKKLTTGKQVNDRVRSEKIDHAAATTAIFFATNAK
jgi:hypothetical protein